MMFSVRGFKNAFILSSRSVSNCSAPKSYAVTFRTRPVPFNIKTLRLTNCASSVPLILFTGRIRAFTVSAVAADTIYAVSSGHGKCGVSVIRVSGPQACNVLHAVTDLRENPQPRHAILTKFLHPNTEQAIDQGLLLWFPGPSSFTGEDCCEFQVHGGLAVVSAMLDAIGCVPGTRHAEPGDYTKRAFQNGKLDLTQVEGLGDLIHAETEAQRHQALRQMQGDLRDLYGSWRKRLLKCVANTEAYIDFSEDDNIEDGILNSVSQNICQLQQEIRGHLSDHRQGERLRSGVHVAILGKPNVGKSSLLNTITRRPAAIVSPVAGTTRDVVETSVNIGGYPALLSDTAGLRETQDVVEKEGVRRALDRAATADLILLVLDATKLKVITMATLRQELQDVGLNCIIDTEESDDTNSRCLMEHHSEIRNDTPDGVFCKMTDWGNMIVVLNKVDLVSDETNCINNAITTLAHCSSQDFQEKNMEPTENSSSEPTLCCVSCSTGEGINALIDVFKSQLEMLCGDPSVGSPSLTQSRHRHHLQDCASALELFSEFINVDIVLAAHHLQHALWHIGKITGSVEPEEILDVIFRDFCIGK